MQLTNSNNPPNVQEDLEWWIEDVNNYQRHKSFLKYRGKHNGIECTCFKIVNPLRRCSLSTNMKRRYRFTH